MFGRQRHLMNTTMFLLIMDCDEQPWSIPEVTLWLDFDTALAAAWKAVSTRMEEEEDFILDGRDISFDERCAFVDGCFEIMPISVSTPNKITWLGKLRRQESEKNG